MSSASLIDFMPNPEEVNLHRGDNDTLFRRDELIRAISNGPNIKATIGGHSSAALALYQDEETGFVTPIINTSRSCMKGYQQHKADLYNRRQAVLNRLRAKAAAK